MKDMIEFTVKDDSDLFKSPNKKSIPKLSQILDIVNDASTIKYQYHLDDLNAALDKNIYEPEGDFKEIIHLTEENEIKERYNAIAKVIRSSQKTPIEIERAELVKNKKKFKESADNGHIKTGPYWSYGGYSEPYGDPSLWSGKTGRKTQVNLISHVEFGEINIVKTIIANLARPNEREIRLIPNSTVKIDEICIENKGKNPSKCEKTKANAIIISEDE